MYNSIKQAAYIQKFARETDTILQRRDDFLKKLDSTKVDINAVQMLSSKLKGLQGDLERITRKFLRSCVNVDERLFARS